VRRRGAATKAVCALFELASTAITGRLTKVVKSWFSRQQNARALSHRHSRWEWDPCVRLCLSVCLSVSLSLCLSICLLMDGQRLFGVSPKPYIAVNAPDIGILVYSAVCPAILRLSPSRPRDISGLVLHDMVTAHRPHLLLEGCRDEASGRGRELCVPGQSRHRRRLGDIGYVEPGRLRATQQNDNTWEPWVISYLPWSWGTFRRTPFSSWKWCAQVRETAVRGRGDQETLTAPRKSACLLFPFRVDPFRLLFLSPGIHARGQHRARCYFLPIDRCRRRCSVWPINEFRATKPFIVWVEDYNSEEAQQCLSYEAATISSRPLCRWSSLSFFLPKPISFRVLQNTGRRNTCLSPPIRESQSVSSRLKVICTGRGLDLRSPSTLWPSKPSTEVRPTVSNSDPTYSATQKGSIGRGV